MASSLLLGAATAGGAGLGASNLGGSILGVGGAGVLIAGAAIAGAGIDAAVGGGGADGAAPIAACTAFPEIIRVNSPGPELGLVLRGVGGTGA